MREPPSANAVYIMASKSGTLYTGVTNDLYERVFEHKTGLNTGFTHKYRCHKLVYFEEFDDIVDAIAREKEIKGWTREKKQRLIRLMNPAWADLAFGWYDEKELCEAAEENELRRCNGPPSS